MALLWFTIAFLYALVATAAMYMTWDERVTKKRDLGQQRFGVERLPQPGNFGEIIVSRPVAFHVGWPHLPQRILVEHTLVNCFLQDHRKQAIIFQLAVSAQGSFSSGMR